jgi:hypothetical protein
MSFSVFWNIKMDKFLDRFQVVCEWFTVILLSTSQQYIRASHLAGIQYENGDVTNRNKY